MNQHFIEIKTETLLRKDILSSLATQIDEVLHVLHAHEADMLTEQDALNMLGAALKPAPDSAKNAVS